LIVAGSKNQCKKKDYWTKGAFAPYRA